MEFFGNRFQRLELERWERGGKGLLMAGGGSAEAGGCRWAAVAFRVCHSMLCHSVCATPCRAKPCHSVGSLVNNQLRLVFLLPRRRGAVSSTHICSRPLSPAPCPSRCLHPPALASRKTFSPGKEARASSAPEVSPAGDNRAFVFPGCERGRREFGCPESCREPFLPQLSTCYKRANKPNHAAGKQALRVRSP